MLMDHDAPGTDRGSADLSLDELSAGVAKGLQASPIDRLDLVGLDMCLMAQLETAFELGEMADVMVASQAIEPGDGWPYGRILPLFGKEVLGSRRVGSEIVAAYKDYYSERGEQGTQSAVDLRAIDDVVKALDQFSAKTGEAAPKAWPTISRSLFYAQSYSGRTDLRAGTQALSSVDLLNTVKRLRRAVSKFPAEQAFAKLVKSMDRAVLASWSSPQYRLSHGLAIYAPVTGGHFNPAYDRTRLARQSAWPKLLRQVHEAQQQSLTAPTISDLRLVEVATNKPVDVVTPGGGYSVEATIKGENVLWVNVLHTLYDTQNKGHLVLQRGFMWDPEYYNKKKEAVADVVDLLMPEFKGAENTVWQEYLGYHMTVTDGEIAARGTLDGSDLNDLGHIKVPVEVKRPGVGQFIATVSFDAITWDAVQVIGQIPQPDGSVALRGIQPQANDDITLLYELIPDDGGEVSYLRGETIKWNKGLELLIDRDSPGEIGVAIQAESIGGRSAFVNLPIKIKAHSKQEQEFITNATKVKASDLIGTWQWHGLKGKDQDPSQLKWQPIPPITEIKRLESNPQVLVARIKNMPDPNWKDQPMAAWWDARLMPTLRLVSFDEQGNAVEAMNFTVLVSRWENGSPRLILKYYEYGELVDAGTYQIRGHTLIGRSQDGDVERYRFKIDGDTLMLRDSSGMELYFYRMQQESESW